MTQTTREDWLTKLTDALRPAFLEAGGELPENIRVTCGWPSQGAKAKKNRRLAECWGPEASDDDHFEIFISPTLDDAVEVGGILVHELAHAAVGVEAGHKAPFHRVAVAMGLEGKMTATTSSEPLVQRLQSLTDKIGLYPHAKLSFKKKKTQGTRMIKVQCPDPACGYQVRTTQKWIDIGLPTCFCGIKMEAEEPEAPEEEAMRLAACCAINPLTRVGNMWVVYFPGINMMGIAQGVLVKQHVEDVARLDDESTLDWHKRAVERARELASI